MNTEQLIELRDAVQRHVIGKSYNTTKDAVNDVEETVVQYLATAGYYYMQTENERSVIVMRDNGDITSRITEDCASRGVQKVKIRATVAGRADEVVNVPYEKIYVSSIDRRIIRGIVYKPYPQAEPAGYINRYGGPGVSYEDAAAMSDGEAAEKAAPFFAHLRKATAGDKNDFEFLMDWAATLYNFPGRKLQSCLAFRGKPGVGKSVIYKALAEVIGLGNTAVPTKEQIRSRFNGFIGRAVLFAMDEIIIEGASRDEVAFIKRLITESRMQVEEKFREPTTVDTYGGFMFFTNEDRSAPVDVAGRKFACYHIVGSLTESQKIYMSKLTSESCTYDRSYSVAIAHELLKRKERVETFTGILEGPTNAETKAQQYSGMNDYQRFAVNVLATRTLGNGSLCETQQQIVKTSVYKHFEEVIGHQPKDVVVFGKTFPKLLGLTNSKCKAGPAKYVVGSYDECLAAFRCAMNDPSFDPSGAPEQDQKPADLEDILDDGAGPSGDSEHKNDDCSSLLDELGL